jgi:hypothetical protein
MQQLIAQAFNSSVIHNNEITFPVAMDDKVFKKIKSMLQDIRGIWHGGKRQCIAFDFNPSDIITAYLSKGQWPKKNPFSLFPTPKSVIDYTLTYTEAEPARFCGYEVVRILEPSAGTGLFIDAVVEAFTKQGITIEVTCAELDPINIAILKGKGYNVIEGDFLQMDNLGEYDLITMNPPFKGIEYAKHVHHAQNMLAHNGKLVAVAPTSLFASPFKEAIELKEQVIANNFGEFEDCVFEHGTFEDTNYETLVFSLLSKPCSKRLIKQMIEQAVCAFVLYVKNEDELNSRVLRCKSISSLHGIKEGLVRRHLMNDRFAFMNDDIANQAVEFLAASSDTINPPNISTPTVGVTAETTLEELEVEPFSPAIIIPSPRPAWFTQPNFISETIMHASGVYA